MKATFALLIGLALVGSTAVVSAQQGRGRGPAGPRPPQRPQPQEPAAAPQFPPPFAAAFDKDSDAVLSPAEIAGASDVLRAMDANQDGELTKEEVCQAVCPNGQQCPAGAAAGQGRGPGFGPRGAQGRGPANVPVIIALFDTERDGKLSVAEINNAPAVLGKLDTNGDAQLTPDEVRPLPGHGRGPRGGNCPMQGSGPPAQN